MQDETHYRVFKALFERPELTQRELADVLGISLGKANYCLREFIRRGLVKVANFKKSNKKQAYMYIVTPAGLEEKVRVTYRFFQAKAAEYELLRQEVERLNQSGEGLAVVTTSEGGQA